VSEFPVLHTRGIDTSSSIRDTLALDKTTDTNSAQVEIYRRLRPSSPPTPEIAANFFENLFRNADYYDLSPVGRYKLNARLQDPTSRWISGPCPNEDILTAVKHLTFLKDSHGPAMISIIWQPAGAAGRSWWKTSTASVWCGMEGPSRSA